MVLPELDAQLEAARRGSYESRSALAISLSKRWKVDQVAAQKLENHVLSAYVLRVDGVDLGLCVARFVARGDGPPEDAALLFSLHCDPALPLALAACWQVHQLLRRAAAADVALHRSLCASHDQSIGRHPSRGVPR